MTLAHDVVQQSLAKQQELSLLNALIYVHKNPVVQEGPLQGLPIVISDAINWAGAPTTYGSLLLKDHMSHEDALETARLKKAGLTLIGKGNMSEFGLDFETTNQLIGPTLNPLDRSLSCGGGASGVAAAVAAGIVPWGVGTDISGGMRVGASLMGLLSLLPTRGRVPIVRRHLLPYSERMFFRKGPIAKDIYNLALLFNYLAAYEPRDPLSPNRPIPDYTQCLNEKPGRLTIGYSADLSFLTVHPEVQQAFEMAIQRFEKAGHTLKKVPLKLSPDLFLHFKEIFGVDRFLLISQMLDAQGEKQKLLSPRTCEWLTLGKEVSGVRYALALTFQGWLEETINTLFQDYDLLLTPALPLPPWPAGHTPQTDDPLVGLWAFLFPFNMSGHPTLVFPTDALIGMQLVAPPFQEERLLQTYKFM